MMILVRTPSGFRAHTKHRKPFRDSHLRHINQSNKLAVPSRSHGGDCLCSLPATICRAPKCHAASGLQIAICKLKPTARNHVCFGLWPATRFGQSIRQPKETKAGPETSQGRQNIALQTLGLSIFHILWVRPHRVRPHLRTPAAQHFVKFSDYLRA